VETGVRTDRMLLLCDHLFSFVGDFFALFSYFENPKVLQIKPLGVRHARPQPFLFSGCHPFHHLLTVLLVRFNNNTLFTVNT